MPMIVSSVMVPDLSVNHVSRHKPVQDSSDETPHPLSSESPQRKHIALVLKSPGIFRVVFPAYICM